MSKSASTPLSTKELYRATVSSRLAGGIGTRWYFMTIFLARSASRLALKKEAGRDVDLRRLRMPSLARDRAFSFLASLLRKGSASSFIPVCDRRTARPDGEHHCGARGRAHSWGGGCQCRAQGKSRAGNDHRQKTPGTRLITPTALGPGTERACTGDLPPRDGGAPRRPHRMRCARPRVAAKCQFLIGRIIAPGPPGTRHDGARASR